MSTQETIKPVLYKISAAQYYQSEGAIQALPDAVRNYGDEVYIISGITAWQAAGEKIDAVLKAAGIPYQLKFYTGQSCETVAQQLAADIPAHFPVIAAVGGGRLLDFAKMAAHYAGKRIITIPTASSTCAAVTPLSVRYTEDGANIPHSLKYDRPVDVCIADLDLIVTETPRLFISGILDSMAKMPEILYYVDDPAEGGTGIDFAYDLSKRMFERGPGLIRSCIKDLKTRTVSADFDRAVYYSIMGAGAVSGFVRGSKQCALAHRFYESTRTLFYREAFGFLHGEIVAVGLYLQYAFNGDTKSAAEMTEILKEWGMPCSLSDLHIPATAETKEKYMNKFAEHGILKESADAYEKTSAAFDELLKRG